MDNFVRLLPYNILLLGVEFVIFKFKMYAALIIHDEFHVAMLFLPTWLVLGVDNISGFGRKKCSIRNH